LRENKVKYNSHTVLVTHGVDFEHFVKACAAETEVPADMASLPRPILGFFGLLADWVDFEAIKKCAQAWPQGSVVLLGKLAPDTDVSVLKGLSNVHFLGRKPYSQLPAYCKGFDVALLPFKQNELTKNANPLKVREYLAAGLPVAATDLPEVRRLGLCHLAKTTEEFPSAVQACLDEGAGCSRARADKISHESWNAKVKDIRTHVALEMRRRGLIL